MFIMNVISRSCYFLHYLFDNFYIISKIMNVRTDKMGINHVRSDILSKWTRRAYKFSRIWWFFGIISFLLYCLKTMRKTYTDESDLKVAVLDKMNVIELKKNLDIISKLRKDYWLHLIRTAADGMICMNENEMPMNVLGKRLNGGVEGVFGMTSSLICLYINFIFVK